MEREIIKKAEFGETRFHLGKAGNWMRRGWLLFAAVFITANPSFAHPYGKLVSYFKDNIYISFDMESAEIVTAVNHARLDLSVRKKMLADRGGTDNVLPGMIEDSVNKLSAIQEQLNQLKKRGLVKEVEPGALAMVIDKSDSDPKGRRTWPVLVLTGKDKGLVGLSSCFDRSGIDSDDRCFLYPNTGYKVALGAFEIFTLKEMLDDLYKGDDSSAGVLLRIGRVLKIESGCRGYCENIDGDWYQIRVLTGKQKGKLLWFLSDSVYPVDRKTLTEAVRGAEKMTHILKPVKSDEKPKETPVEETPEKPAPGTDAPKEDPQPPPSVAREGAG